MSEADVQRLFDMMLGISSRMSAVETEMSEVKGLIKQRRNDPVDVSRLRWDGQALNYVATKIIVPIVVTTTLAAAALYYGIHAQVSDIAFQLQKHTIEKGGH